MENKDRVNLFIAKICYMVTGFATSIIMLYLPIYIFHFSRSYLAVSMIFTLPAIAAFFGQNLWGYLAGSTGKIKIFLLTTVIAYLIFFLSVLTLKNHILILSTLGLLSIFHIAMVPPLRSYTTILHPEKKGEALGELSSFDSLGWTVGSTAGILLFLWKNDISQIYLLFQIILCITAVLFFIIIFFFTETSLSPRQMVKENMIKKLKFIYTRSEILTGILIILSISTPSILFFSMYSIFFCDYIGADKWLMSLSMSIASFTGAIAYYIYGKIADRTNPLYLVYGAVFAYMFLFFTFIFVKNPIVITVFYALPFYPAVSIATGKHISEVTEEHERGLGLGAIEGAYALAKIIAPLIAGGAVNYCGIVHLPLVSLIVLMAGFFIVYVMRLREKTLSWS